MPEKCEHLACPECGNDTRLRFTPMLDSATYGRCMDCGHLWDLPVANQWIN